MPYALVMDLSIVYPNRHLRATTHGNGIFERSLVPNPLVGIANNSEIPKEFGLSQNYPNPFNPITNFELRIKNYGFVSLKVFDARGREITTLVNENMKPGVYNVKFDGSGYSSGVYFYRMTVRQAGSSTGDFSETRKMVMVK